ncbi:hypothetical protein Tco_0738533 [Tanacetum coccineum]
MDPNFTNENDQWEYSLDIDDYDLNLTHALYVQKVVEDVGEDSDFNSGAWISATNYVLSTGGTVTGCLGDLNVTMKDLSGTVRGTVFSYSIRKRTGRDPKGNIMILPPVSVEEHIVVQRETKARTILLQSLPEDHMADFHHLDDARVIWVGLSKQIWRITDLERKWEKDEVDIKDLQGLNKKSMWENGAAQVYGMIAGAEDDAAGSATGDATSDVADDVSNAAAEFALWLLF